MLEFFRRRRSPCPICLGRATIIVDDIYEKCPGCNGSGHTLETSERTDLDEGPWL